MTPTGLVLDYGGVLTDFGDTSCEDAEPPLVRAVRMARQAGLRTAVLSNAVLEQGLAVRPEGFDAIVVSGVVGVAKPDPEIYLLTADRLGLAPADCVFVDDQRSHVSAAVAVGMIGVHHRTVASTLDELEILFEPVRFR